MFSLAALTILPGVMEEHAVNIREGVNQQLRVITESGKVVGGDGLGSLNWTKMMPFMKITTSSETEQISDTSTCIDLNRYLSAFTLSSQCRVKITEMLCNGSHDSLRQLERPGPGHPLHPGQCRRVPVPGAGPPQHQPRHWGLVLVYQHRRPVGIRRSIEQSDSAVFS